MELVGGIGRNFAPLYFTSTVHLFYVEYWVDIKTAFVANMLVSDAKVFATLYGTVNCCALWAS